MKLLENWFRNILKDKKNMYLQFLASIFYQIQAGIYWKFSNIKIHEAKYESTIQSNIQNICFCEKRPNRKWICILTIHLTQFIQRPKGNWKESNLRSLREKIEREHESSCQFRRFSKITCFLYHLLVLLPASFSLQDSHVWKTYTDDMDIIMPMIILIMWE